MKYIVIFFMSFLFSISCTDETAEQENMEEKTQEEEIQDLEQLFDEIEDVSLSISCEDVTDWAFVAYGSKACGGPQGYIAYSTTIDVTQFLQLVEDYTATEDAFNQRWGVISDCAIFSPPSSVICRDGLPVLIYECPFVDGDTESACNDVPPTDEECDAAFERWFYSQSSNTCELLAYSGCELYGFATKEECDSCLCTER